LVAISNDYFVWGSSHANDLSILNLHDNVTVTIKLPLCVQSLCIHGNIVATGGAEDYKVNLYDLKSGNLLESYVGHHERVIAITVTDNYVVATSYKEQLLWRRNSDIPPKQLMGLHSGATSVDSDENTIIIGNAQGLAKLIIIFLGDRVPREYYLETGKYLGSFVYKMGGLLGFRNCLIKCGKNFLVIFLSIK
jgi:WD40 repeat protein